MEDAGSPILRLLFLSFHDENGETVSGLRKARKTVDSNSGGRILKARRARINWWLSYSWEYDDSGNMTKEATYNDDGSVNNVCSRQQKMPKKH